MRAFSMHRICTFALFAPSSFAKFAHLLRPLCSAPARTFPIHLSLSAPYTRLVRAFFIPSLTHMRTLVKSHYLRFLFLSSSEVFPGVELAAGRSTLAQKKAQTVITHFAVPNTVSIAEFQQQKLSDRVHENSWIAKLKCVHFEINAVGRMGAIITNKLSCMRRVTQMTESCGESWPNASFPSKGGGAGKKRGKQEERKTAHM